MMNDLPDVRTEERILKENKLYFFALACSLQKIDAHS